MKKQNKQKELDRKREANVKDTCKVRLPCGPKPIRTISGFWELISRFEFDFRRGNHFLKAKKFNHTPLGCSCACAVACLCPQNSISNVVVSVTTCIDIFK